MTITEAGPSEVSDSLPSDGSHIFDDAHEELRVQIQDGEDPAQSKEAKVLPGLNGNVPVLETTPYNHRGKTEYPPDGSFAGLLRVVGVRLPHETEWTPAAAVHVMRDDKGKLKLNVRAISADSRKPAL